MNEIPFNWESIDLTEEELWKRFERVAGEIECDICGKRYDRHPMEPRTLTSEGEPWLYRLCCGILGKT